MPTHTKHFGLPAFGVFTLIALIPFLSSQLAAQEASDALPSEVSASDVGSDKGKTAKPDEELHFSFERAPWRDVIRWLSDECDLALQYEELPTGSFSYSDDSDFTQQEAIDRVNLFLLPQGYTLVRSGKLLSVINLGDPRSMQQLDALAALTTSDKLAELPAYEVVKCVFQLGELSAEDAVDELSVLNLLTEPMVFRKTNQLMITDTVTKLRSVKAILDAFQPKGLENGTIMKTFPLEYVDAEDILVVARPHLGLATGEMIGIDVSLSSDLQGKNIFVTGVEDRVKLIEGLVQALDRPSDNAAAMAGENELRSHLVAGGNVETVFNVLQTLLAGKPIRLSMDDEASSIVALASPEVQREIADTVAQLQATEADFEVIPLKTVDPYFAISLLEEMLDLPDSFTDPEDIPPDTPKIDADPGNMRLFVRAKPNQIEKIKKIVEGLDSGEASFGEEMRVLPFKGADVERTLETAAAFWRKENPIVLLPSVDSETPQPTERIVGEVAQAKPKLPGILVSSNADHESSSARFLTDNIRSQAPLIRCQVTERGLIIQSDDASALDEFEQHLKAIAGPMSASPSPPVVFYLQYTKPDDALRLLAELLDGWDSAKEAEADTLVNGYVSSSDSYLGSLVTSREGMTTMMAGTITVVADSRLNRLIAQGTDEDIALIEGYLKIIDKDNSIADVKTYGTSHVIELVNTSATEVAAAIREAYAGRIAGATTGAAAAGGRGAKPDPRAVAKAEGNEKEGNEKKAAAKGVASQPVRDLEPKMTVAVHEPSNSLIVTAPEQLFLEVEQLAKLIDTRSEQTIEIPAPTNGAVLQAILQPGSQGPERSSGSSRGERRSDTSSRSQVLDFLKSRGSQN